MLRIISIIVGVICVTLLILWLFGERWRFLRPSTWRLIQKGGLRRFITLSTLHSYIYWRWTNQYIKLLINVLSCMGTRIRRLCLHRYYSKVLTTEQTKTIITINKEITLQELEQIIPYSIAQDIILNGPPDIAVYECACRHARTNPCQPTRVCLIIGQPFVDFVLDHNPQSSHRLTQAEALELLQAEHKRGHLHSAWFKGSVMWGRLSAICNCCKCCCGGIEAMVKYGIPIMAPSGYVAQVNKILCSNCAICEGFCPFGAIQVNNTAIVKWETCMGCGVCVGQCPNGAISLVWEEKKGMPIDVHYWHRNK